MNVRGRKGHRLRLRGAADRALHLQEGGGVPDGARVQGRPGRGVRLGGLAAARVDHLPAQPHQCLDLEKQFPDAKVGKMELLPPAILTNPRNVGDLKVLSGRSDDVAHKILDWAREGFIVINLIRLYTSDPQAAARAIPYFESNIQRLEGLEEILRFLDTQGFEREAESLMRKMHDPSAFSTWRRSWNRCGAASRASTS